MDTVLEWRWDNVLNTPTVVRYLIRNLEGRVIESYCLLLCSLCIVLCVPVVFACGALLFRIPNVLRCALLLTLHVARCCFVFDIID